MASLVKFSTRHSRYDFVDMLDDEPEKLEMEVPPEFSPTQEEEESEKKVPQHIKLVTAIVEKILHVLPHRDTSNKILIIEVT